MRKIEEKKNKEEYVIVVGGLVIVIMNIGLGTSPKEKNLKAQTLVLLSSLGTIITNI